MTEAVDILHAGETTTADSMRFSYSRPEQRWLRRSIIRGIEQISGQPYLERLYRDWTANPPAGENLFAAAIRLLEIDVRGRKQTKINGNRCACTEPRDKPVL